MPQPERRVVIAATVATTIEAFVSPQIPDFRERGWRIFIVCSNTLSQAPWDTTNQKIRMSRGISPLIDIVGLIRWIVFLRRTKPDLVLGSTPKAGFLSMLSSLLVGVPKRIFLYRGAVWQSETGLRRFLIIEMEKLTFACATDVISVSHSLAELAVKNRIARDMPRVFGHGGSKGVDLDKFHVVEVKEQRDPTLGFIGRLSSAKGINVVLDTFEHVRRENLKAKLLIAGDIDEADPITDAIKFRIENTEGVRWIGHTDDPSDFLNSIDVLVFPSLREGLPNVVIEAAACGVPTVGWDVTGVCDAVLDGVTGRVVKVGDFEGFYNEAAKLLFRPDMNVRSLCRDWARNFDQNLITRQLLDFLDEAVPVEYNN